MSKFFANVKPLVNMQLKDKLDFKFFKSAKSSIQKIVFTLLKFLIVTAVVSVLVYFIDFIGIINKTELINVYIVFLTIYSILTMLGNMSGLTKTLYYADDNKVLVTLPVSSSKLFFSKIIVYYVFDFFKSLEILYPVTIGFGIGELMLGQITFGALLWSVLPLTIFSMIMVLIAAIFSIAYLYVYKFLKSHAIAELILLIILVGAAVTLVIWLIGLIPEDIDLVNQWPSMRNTLQNFLGNFAKCSFPTYFVSYCMFGKHIDTNIRLNLIPSCFVDFAILFGILVALTAIVYFVVKPFYFNMMTKTFEFDKKQFDAPKKNVKHKKYVTFVNKELRLSFRDVEISGSYLIIYLAVPILLYFIDTVFSAISTRLEGDIMTYAFNVLLIILPYLASNSVIATLYSKEGRAAYIKKTKPISTFIPLSSKLLFNLALSIPSVVACGIVFGNFANIGWVCPVLLSLSVLLIQYGHIFFSATRDIMNPQNEAYATSGNEISNPNERVSTIVGFVIAFAIALISFILFRESYLAYNSYIVGFIKIFAISAAIFVSFFLLFIWKIKAYYYEK